MSGQDFADAYICANSKVIGATGILTFNKKHFERMEAIIADV
jgi:predicted nucleic-acid-binding protein